MCCGVLYIYTVFVNICAMEQRVHSSVSKNSGSLLAVSPGETLPLFARPMLDLCTAADTGAANTGAADKSAANRATMKKDVVKKAAALRHSSGQPDNNQLFNKKHKHKALGREELESRLPQAVLLHKEHFHSEYPDHEHPPEARSNPGFNRTLPPNADRHMQVAFQLAQALKGRGRHFNTYKKLSEDQKHQVGHSICEHLLASLRDQVAAESHSSTHTRL